jgi:hypothetical protein
MKAKERRAAADFLSDNLRALEDGRGRERVSSGKEWVQGSSEANSSRDSRREHGAFFAVSQQRGWGEIYITRIETFSSYLITIPPREKDQTTITTKSIVMYTSSVSLLGAAALLAGSAQAALVEHYWNISYTQANPDGLFERRVIGVNGSWPYVSTKSESNISNWTIPANILYLIITPLDPHQSS